MVKQYEANGEQVILGREGALVASRSEPGLWHVVRDGGCDCAGFFYRQRCRHVAAAKQARREQGQWALALINATLDEQYGTAA